MNQTTKSKISHPGSTEAVKFTDGMLVTAEDLNAATHYPLAVTQVLLRSYFGCGIVCGLTVARPKKAVARSLMVEVGRGVALGCDGYPIDLCDSPTLDLSPDKCGPAAPEGEIVKYIAIRRIAATTPAPRECGCGPAAGEPGQQCSRLRDHVIVQVFEEDDLPAGTCMRPRPIDGEPQEQGQSGACECMTHCPDCDPCAEPWVLIATVLVDGETMVINSQEGVAKYGGPRWVKPIDCLCRAEDGHAKKMAEVDKAFEDMTKKLRALDDRIKKLETPRVPAAGGAGAA